MEINKKGVYGYWDHMDYIISQAEKNGIYIAMVPIWGGLVKAGLMSVDDAASYGRVLAERYKDSPNIIWAEMSKVTSTRTSGTPWHVPSNRSTRITS